MPPSVSAPFESFAQEVELWRHATNLNPAERASAHIVLIDTVAREVGQAAGSDVIMILVGKKQISGLLYDYFAPRAVGSVYREVVRNLEFKRAAQKTDGYFARLDLLRREPESKVRVGGVSAEAFASVICAQNASPSRPEKSPALPSVQGNLGISAVARQMCRLSGPREDVARQDVWVATDVDAN